MSDTTPTSKKTILSTVISASWEEMTPFATFSGRMTVNHGLKDWKEDLERQVTVVMGSLLEKSGSDSPI